MFARELLTRLEITPVGSSIIVRYFKIQFDVRFLMESFLLQVCLSDFFVQATVGIGSAAALTDKQFGSRELIGTIIIVVAAVVDVLRKPTVTINVSRRKRCMTVSKLLIEG